MLTLERFEAKDVVELTHEELDAIPWYPLSTAGPLGVTLEGTLFKRRDRGMLEVGIWHESTPTHGPIQHVKWKEARPVFPPRMKPSAIVYLTGEEVNDLPTFEWKLEEFEKRGLGSRVKRKLTGSGTWELGEVTSDGVTWKEIRICMIQERIRMIREEKLAEFQAVWDKERTVLQEQLDSATDSILKLSSENKDLKAFKESMIAAALVFMTNPDTSVGNALAVANLKKRVQALESKSGKKGKKGRRPR